MCTNAAKHDEGERRSGRFESASRTAIGVALFLVILLTHFYSGVFIRSDFMWTMPTTASILREGNTDLNEYGDLLAKRRYYATREYDGRYYNFLPIGPSLVALPFAAIAYPLLHRYPGILRQVETDPPTDPNDTFSRIAHHRDVELFIAAIIVAITGILIYAVALHFAIWRYAVLVVFVYAYCTPAWSIASRGLWQHGPCMLMLALALYLFVVAERRPAVAQFAAIPIFFSYLIRPTNAIAIVVFTGYMAVHHRRYLLHYLLWGVPILLAFFLHSYSITGSITPEYYRATRVGFHPGFPRALAGMLVSPGRGLFIFTPVMIPAIYGVYVRIRSREFGWLDASLAAIIILHWVATATFPDWAFGHFFGPRYFTDTIPYFTYFLIFVVRDIAASKGTRRLALAAVFVLCAGFSFFVHYRGANSLYPYSWNVEPTDVFKARERIWDWRDLQFLRGLGKPPWKSE